MRINLLPLLIRRPQNPRWPSPIWHSLTQIWHRTPQASIGRNDGRLNLLLLTAWSLPIASLVSEKRDLVQSTQNPRLAEIRFDLSPQRARLADIIYGHRNVNYQLSENKNHPFGVVKSFASTHFEKFRARIPYSFTSVVNNILINKHWLLFCYFLCGFLTFYPKTLWSLKPDLSVDFDAF